ncbi:MAG: hypothetical protein V3W34_07505, partial [Phycisphaerae bacterium]
MGWLACFCRGDVRSGVPGDAGALLMWLRMLATIAVLAFLGALLYAAYHDATTYRIPNWLSVAIVADFLFA